MNYKILGVLFLAFAAGAAPAFSINCLSSDEAKARGVSQEDLDGEHSPALHIWGENDAAAAWQAFVQPLEGSGGSLSVYYTEAGAVDLVIVSGDEEKAAHVCAALGTLDAFRWPLPADRPFRQCGTVHVTSAPAEQEFELRVTRKGTVADVHLVNVSTAPQQLFVSIGGLWEDLGVFVWTDGAEEPKQLQAPTRPGGVVDLKVFGPGESMSATIDLTDYLFLDSGVALGETPGHHMVRLLLSCPSHRGSLGGVLWSEAIRIEVEDGGV